jgi:shikimate dehydrogenase
MRFSVIGDPVAHSKSPLMHNAAYRALGMPHSYEAIRVSNEIELGSIIDQLRNGTLSGVNVTFPHKREVLAWVDEVDEVVKAVGAANTLYLRGGRICATNTDAPAIKAELGSLGLQGPDRALVIGSGGAARAAIVALCDSRDIVVYARSPDAIVLEMSPKTSARLTAARSVVGSFDCIVQATSAGMTGADPGEPIADAIDWTALSDATVVLETIYSPRETPVLRAARARGLVHVNGLGVLARQGALAFEIWLGEAPLDVMRAAISR